MDDLIRRQDAIDAFIEWYGNEPCDIDYFKELLDESPSAQKKGHWIDTNPDEPLDPRQTCSECGNTEVLHVANFCPNCGADMRGESDARFNQQTGGD